MDHDLTDLKEGENLIIREEKLLAHWSLASIGQLLPLGDPPQPNSIIWVLPSEWRENWKQDLTLKVIESL